MSGSSDAGPVPKEFELGSLIRTHDLRLTPVESPEERTHRIQGEEKDADARRRREGVAFYSALFLVVAVGITALVLVVTGSPRADWAETALGSVLAGAVGYTLGRGANR